MYSLQRITQLHPRQDWAKFNFSMKFHYLLLEMLVVVVCVSLCTVQQRYFLSGLRLVTCLEAEPDLILLVCWFGM